MYNTIFTAEPFAGILYWKKKYKSTTNVDGKIICGVCKKNICDLNGKKIAIYDHSEMIEIRDGKKLKARVYIPEQNEQGAQKEFKVIADGLFVNDEQVGSIAQQQTKGALRVMLMAATAVTLALSIVFIWLVTVPLSADNTVPVILIEDDENVWIHNKTIGVFPPSLKPGSSGQYEFIIKNPHKAQLMYSFTMVHMYNEEVINEFPIRYRLKMNNAYISTAEAWNSGSDMTCSDWVLLGDTQHAFTLEWEWPFEGDDGTDTNFGRDSGEYSIAISVSAEPYTEAQ